MKKSFVQKLGEILAFSQRGVEIYQKNRSPLQAALDPTEIDNVIHKNQEISNKLVETLKKSPDAADATETEMQEKAEKSIKKFKAMEDVYLEGSKEPAEVMEWLGFFEGSAMVHFSLVHDMAKEEKLDDFAGIAKDGEKFHHDTLHKIRKSIAETEK